MIDLDKLAAVLADPKKLEGVQAALEYGYDGVREVFADGSGESSPQQDGVYEAMEALGIR